MSVAERIREIHSDFSDVLIEVFENYDNKRANDLDRVLSDPQTCALFEDFLEKEESKEVSLEQALEQGPEVSLSRLLFYKKVEAYKNSAKVFSSLSKAHDFALKICLKFLYKGSEKVLPVSGEESSWNRIKNETMELIQSAVSKKNGSSEIYDVFNPLQSLVYRELCCNEFPKFESFVHKRIDKLLCESKSMKNSIDTRLNDAGKQITARASINEAVECFQGVNLETISACINFFRTKGRLKEEGIFRTNGKGTRIDQVVRFFLHEYKEGDIDAMETMVEKGLLSVHDMASVFKRLLSISVTEYLPMKNNNDLVSSFLKHQNCSEEDIEHAIQQTVKKFPSQISEFFSQVISFLREVAFYSFRNKMDPYAVAVCIGPSLLPCIDGDSDPYSGQISRIQCLEFMLKKDFDLRHEKLENSSSLSNQTASKIAIDSKSKKMVPIMLRQCFEFLWQPDRIRAENMFATNPSSKVLSRIQTHLKQYKGNPRDIIGDLALENYVDVAAAVKVYLKGLPTPLISGELFERMSNICSDHFALGESRQQRAHRFASLLGDVPDTQRYTLCYILFFLNCVAQHNSINHMSAENLAGIFAPVLVGVHGYWGYEDIHEAKSQIKHFKKVLSVLIATSHQFSDVVEHARSQDKKSVESPRLRKSTTAPVDF
mmetsp:Transcript_9723/g.11203  ORF Transcript_9723/g.11203 Transcript_9723/m.11203 type:complete len:658 (+) Transcript_9723:121-2094(+)